MKRYKRHIAFLLALLFVFPVAYQSWHVVHHKEYTHYKPLLKKIVFTQETEYCLVCEYEFTKYENSKTEKIHFSNSACSEINQYLIPSNQNYFRGASFSLRAPPFAV